MPRDWQGNLLRNGTKVSVGMTLALFKLMRVAKACRVGCAKIGSKLYFWATNLALIVFVALVGAVVFFSVKHRKQPPPPPITVAVVGPANNASENSLTRVLVTNLGRDPYNYALCTEVLFNGSWQDASLQWANARFELSPKSNRTLSVRIPPEGQAWRVKLVANRVLSGVETKFDQLLRWFKPAHPLQDNSAVIGQPMNKRSELLAGIDQK